MRILLEHEEGEKMEKESKSVGLEKENVFNQACQ